MIESVVLVHELDVCVSRPSRAYDGAKEYSGVPLIWNDFNRRVQPGIRMHAHEVALQCRELTRVRRLTHACQVAMMLPAGGDGVGDIEVERNEVEQVVWLEGQSLT